MTTLFYSSRLRNAICHSSTYQLSEMSNIFDKELVLDPLFLVYIPEQSSRTITQAYPLVWP